jgi:DNA-binding protein HU-beta
MVLGRVIKSRQAPVPTPQAVANPGDSTLKSDIFCDIQPIRRSFSLRGRGALFESGNGWRCTPTSIAKSTPRHIMAKALTKSQLAAAIADQAEIPKKQAVEILDLIAALAYKHAKNTFTLPGLGKLVLVNRKARIGRNPATGAEIKIPAKKVVKFRVAKAAKEAIIGTK